MAEHSGSRRPQLVRAVARSHVRGTTETYSRKFNAQRARDGIRDLVAEAQHIRTARSGARFQTFVGADMQTYFHLRAIADGRDQMAELLGNDSYEMCARDLGGDGNQIEQTFILSQSANGPKLVLEPGYEL